MNRAKPTLADAYPLQWPLGWTRTAAKARQGSRYRTTLGRARDGLLDELRKLGARDVVISSDIPIRRDGLPYASARMPDDPGVAVYWTLGEQPQVIACDKWLRVDANMHALELAVSALRQLERTGASEILSRAFQGFAALPAAAGVSSWRGTLGFKPDAALTLDEVRARWKRLSFNLHPDRTGGDAGLFRSVQRAWEDAQRELAP